MKKRLLIFLLLNFGALAIGGIFTGPGVTSDWYTNLAQAPWTPPGWVFGAAWTTIMICFSIYMALLWPKADNKKQFLGLYAMQWVLNVLWNPIFFYFHQVALGLIVISTLTIIVAVFLAACRNKLPKASYLLLPYLIWLCIATSLNAYILFNN